MDEENKMQDLEQTAQEQNTAETVEAIPADEAVQEEPKGKKSKKTISPEKRRKKRIIGWSITGSIIGVIVLAVAILAIANAVAVQGLMDQAAAIEAVAYTHDQLIPQEDTDGYWAFSTNDDFNVIQITDVHIGGGFLSAQNDLWAMNAVANMVRERQPDLVVVTGDISFPVPYKAGTFNNLSAIKVFAQEMESLQVYWTFAFGNHDTEAYSYYNRKQISDWLETKPLKYCLYKGNNPYTDKKEAEEFGYGNSIIKIKNKDTGAITQAIVCFDSHSYTDGDVLGALWKYDNIHQNQIDWYSAEMAKLRESNNGVTVKNLAFFHIPLREYRDAWKEYRDNKYADTLDVQKIYGVNGEEYGASQNDLYKEVEPTYGVYCGVYREELIGKMWAAAKANGMQGAFCGHDHINNFSLVYTHDDYTMRLTYGMSVDYLAYSEIFKQHSQRGCTAIVIKADGSFDCEALNYYKDFGKQPEAGTLDDLD